MDQFQSMMERMLAPMMQRLANLEGSGGEDSDVEFEEELIPVRENSDAEEDEEEAREGEEKIPVGAKPKRIQIVNKGQFGIQKPVFTKGKKSG